MAFIEVASKGCESFAGELEVEGSEADAEGLEHRAGVGHVHVEVLRTHSPKLHVDVVVVVLVYQLKVLDRCLVYSSVEIQHECLHLCGPKIEAD